MTCISMQLRDVCLNNDSEEILHGDYIQEVVVKNRHQTVRIPPFDKVMVEPRDFPARSHRIWTDSVTSPRFR